MNQNEYPYFYNPNLADIINQKINERIMYYASLYILKKMSLPKEDGGITFKILTDNSNDYEILEPIFDFLYQQNLIRINSKNQSYEVSEEGNAYVENLIDEIESYIDQYQEYDIENRILVIQKDRLDPFRIRFLWGLYDGEFDNLVEWKNKNHFLNSNNFPYKNWAGIITNENFYLALYYNIFLKKVPIERIFFYLEHPDFN